MRTVSVICSARSRAHVFSVAAGPWRGMYFKTERAISPSNTTLSGHRACLHSCSFLKCLAVSGSVKETAIKVPKKASEVLRLFPRVPQRFAMKVNGYVYCALVFVSLQVMSNSASLRSRVDPQFLENIEPDQSNKMKRPFCNAFTGCGRKRSSVEYNLGMQGDNSQSIRLSVPLFKALLRATSPEIRENLDCQSDDCNVQEVSQDISSLARKMINRDRYDS
ncbi:uncharacterized protein LOC105701334 isoform X2 [Orussus abietinus]|nr:uncharacterized protein LOC105701334 isoform X2 [Orussus abietinus]